MVQTSAFVHLSSELLAAGYSITFRASGGSMHPAICDGDRITIRPGVSAPGPGTVVAYRRDGRLFVHRVVQVDAGARSFLLRGDSTCGLDAPVPAHQLLGVVVAVRPTAGSTVRRATVWLHAAVARGLAPLRLLNARLA
jgi:SOS-response transcriptional repressor LexA